LREVVYLRNSCQAEPVEAFSDKPFDKLRVTTSLFIYFLVINAGSVQAQQSVVAEDTAYIKVVNERAAKIVAVLGIAEGTQFTQVQNIIAQQYRHLNQVHESSKATITSLKQSTSGTKEAIAEAIKKEEEARDAKLAQLHTAYIKQLQTSLTAEQVEKVKDGMTYRIAHYLRRLPGYDTPAYGCTEATNLYLAYRGP
jgi:hypothetical protein